MLELADYVTGICRKPVEKGVGGEWGWGVVCHKMQSNRGAFVANYTRGVMLL